MLLIDKLVKNQHDSLKSMLIQFIKFGIVGVSNTFITLSSYWLFLYIGLPYIPSYAVAYSLGIVNAYFWNNRYVFNKNVQQRNHVHAASKVVVSYVFTFILSEALLYLQIDILHWSDTIAPILNLFLTIPINFLLNKYWAFGEKKKAK